MYFSSNMHMPLLAQFASPQRRNTKEQSNAMRSCVVVQVQDPMLRTGISRTVDKEIRGIFISRSSPLDYDNSY